MEQLTPLLLLVNLVLGILSSASWDAIKFIPQFIRLIKGSKTLEQLYLASWDQAVQDNLDYLLEVTDGRPPEIDHDKLLEILHARSITLDDKTLRSLTDDDCVNKVAAEFSKDDNSVLILPGHKLLKMDYEQRLYRVVKSSVMIYRSKIVESEEKVLEDISKQGAENYELTGQVLAFLKERISTSIKEMREDVRDVKRGTKFLIDKQFPICYISSSDPKLADYVSKAKTYLESEKPEGSTKKRRYTVESTPNSEVIANCELFIGLYADNFYLENSIHDLKLAMDNFRRCFCFVASSELSGKLHQSQKKDRPSFASNNFQPADFEKQKFSDGTSWLQRRFELFASKLFQFEDPIVQREKIYKDAEDKRVHEKIKAKRAEDNLIRACQIIDIQNDEAEKHFRSQAEKQQKILNAIKAYYPYSYYVFDKNFDIQVKVLAESLENSPDWYGLSALDIDKCWGELSETKAKNIRNTALKLDGRPFLPSPLWPLWEAFCSQSWLGQIQVAVRNLQSVAEVIGSHPEMKSYLESLRLGPKANTFTGNWNTVPSALLSEWYSEEKIVQMKNSLQRLLGTKRKDDNLMALRQLETDLKTWNNASQEYLSLLKHPKFGRCFLVMGRSGSGKTHFIAELLGRQSMQNQMKYRCIYLDEITKMNDTNQTSWAKDLETLMLDKATLIKVTKNNETLGRKRWESFSELVDFLTQAEAGKFSQDKIVVILDDIGAWMKHQGNPELFLENLSWFIASHTSVKSLVWIITLNEANFADIAIENDFWDKYSSQFLGQSWLSLDDLNERGYTDASVNIKANSAFRNIFKSSGFEITQLKLNRESIDLLSIPLVAWIALDWLLGRPADDDDEFPDVQARIDALPNLHYIDFVQMLYEGRKPKIGKNLSDLQATTQEISRGLVCTPEENQKGRNLINIPENVDRANIENRGFNKNKMILRLGEYYSGETKLWNPDIAGAILKSLEEKGFLRKPSHERAGDIVKLDTKPYWEYQAAYHFRNRIIGEGADRESELERLFGANGISKTYDGIVEFSLLLADQDGEIEYPRLLEINKFIFKNLPNLRDMVWFSASKASGSYQYAFANWVKDQVKEQSLKFHDKNDLQGFLYFLRYAVTPPAPDEHIGVSWNLRFDLATRYFKDINDFGLMSYFAKYILGDMRKSLKNGEECATALAHLRGIENQIEPEILLREMANIPYVDLETYPQEVRSKWTLLGAWGFETLRGLLSKQDDWKLLNTWTDRMMDEVITVNKNILPIFITCAEKDRIWAGILEHYYEALTVNKGVETLQWLKDNSWSVWEKKTTGFTGKIEKFEDEVYEKAQENLTIWLGRWWRNNPSSRQKLGDKITEFLENIEVKDEKKGSAKLQKRKASFQEITVAIFIYYTKPRNKKANPLDFDVTLKYIFIDVKRSIEKSSDEIIVNAWDTLWTKIQSGFEK